MDRPTLPRLTTRDVLQAVLDNFSLERGLVRTLVDLFVRPRVLFETWFFHDRQTYVKPLTLLMLTLAAAVLSCRHFLPAGNAYSPNLILKITATTPADVEKLMLLREYDDVFRLLLVPSASVVSYLMFRRQGWNFAEHLVFNTYILAAQFCLSAVLLPIGGLNHQWVPELATIVCFLLTYARCMDGHRLGVVCRAVVTLVASSMVFLIVFYPFALWVI